jgi:integrase
MAKLTAASVEKLKHDGSKYQREVPDAGRRGQRGLYLIIQPNGAKSWAVRYRFRGKQRKLTFRNAADQIARYPAFGLTEARAAAMAVLLRVSEGEDPAHEKKLARRRDTETGDTFEPVVANFIEKHAKKNRTWREAARLLGIVPKKDSPDTLVAVRDGVVWRWSKRKLSDIKRRDVRELLDKIKAPMVANRTLSQLRTVFNWAIERDLVDANPCLGIKKPHRETPRDRVLDNAEIIKFWSATAFVTEPFGKILRLCLLTGCRLNEVAGMTRDELSEDGAIWNLPGERTKNRKPHQVPLPPLARAEIATAMPIGKLVFSITGRPVAGWSKVKHRLDAAMLAEAKKERGEDATIEPWVQHDLRRTAATSMAELGIAPHIVEAALNHISGAKAGVAGVYNRAAYATEKKAALERWAAHVESITSGKPADNVVAMHERSRS